ncbi:hypothetical protein Dda_9448 [Drechslerella dactyloides]|uniref:Uncharacterized protein n=1 Tax=Drechslerella dactyloides TaxID=74499 RepID=A0AAD6IPC0_DREDA|nr:hypothetical protein Dda_9448 [Drechslerella dactyloides]
MSYSHQHQYLHSSVLPSLVGMDNRRQPRPLSEATSIASSIDFDDASVLHSPRDRLSKAPTYRYSTYDDMDLPEDVEEEEEEYIIDDIQEVYEGDEDAVQANLYSKTIIMNSWLADGARDSVGSDGMKTASSCDEAKTPTTPPMDFGAPQEMSMKRSTVGPRGPHLFSSIFLQAHQSEEHLEDDYLPPISPIRESSYSSPYSRRSPIGSQHSLHIPQPPPRQHLPIDIDVNERPVSAMSMALEDMEGAELENWSPSQVCDWMRRLGFEDSLIYKFRQNDISGAILMQLKWEDLKELDIQSFGKRIELWSELNHLRKSPIGSSTSPKRELSFEMSSVHSPPLLSRHASRKSRESKFRHSPNLSASPSSYTSSPSTVTRSNTVATSRPSAPGPRKVPLLRISTDVASLQPRSHPRLQTSAPVESDSEEEIEEVDEFSDHEEYETEEREDEEASVPMTEKRRPTGLSIIIPSSALEVPPSLNSADSRSSHDGASQGERKHKPLPRFTAPNPAKRRISKRLSTPISPVSASIDIFAAPSVLGLSLGKRLTMVEAESPRWGNDELHTRSPWAPSICASSDVLSPSDRGDMKLKADELRKVSALSAQEQVNKFITLQHLQRLEERAPSSLKHETTREASPLSPHSALSVKSQPVMSKAVQRSTSLRSFDRHKPRPLQLSDEAVAPGPASADFTPRNLDQRKVYPLADSTAAQGSVPPMLRSATAPGPPLASQSTPALVRSASASSPKLSQEATLTRSNSIVSKKGSTTGSGKKPRSLGKSVIDTVNEEAEWEDTSSHGSTPASPSERVFTGEMKKKANHFLRNEWVNHRVELRGTKLTIFKSTTGRDVLMSLEIDDYSVTCTTAGSNKFKGLKTSSKKDSDGMYHFQLVPNQEAKKSGEPKKEHHFTVSSREERIDWMRELMLAKAIKQKKSGFQVEVNGKMM